MKEKEKKRVTISDIARMSGYSKTAVSFAFNSPHRISAEARKRILDTAKELKYIPDPMARNFSLGRHQSLGFLLPQDTGAALANPYTVEVIRGLGIECQKRGCTLTIIPPINDSIFEAVKNAMVDGLVTMGYIMDDGAREVIRVRALPLVMIDGSEDETTFSINIDDEEAAYTQLKEVLAKGHRDIAIVSLPKPAFQDDTAEAGGLVAKRLQGYAKALEETGQEMEAIPSYSVTATRISGVEVASEILSLEKRPTAVIAMSDIVAIGIIQGLRQNGIKVPEDISVVGFDNIREAELIEPALTTIDQPAFEKGLAAARAVFSVIDGNPVDRTACHVPFSFIERDSLRNI